MIIRQLCTFSVVVTLMLQLDLVVFFSSSPYAFVSIGLLSRSWCATYIFTSSSSFFVETIQTTNERTNERTKNKRKKKQIKKTRSNNTNDCICLMPMDTIWKTGNSLSTCVRGLATLSIIHDFLLHIDFVMKMIGQLSVPIQLHYILGAMFDATKWPDKLTVRGNAKLSLVRKCEFRVLWLRFSELMSLVVVGHTTLSNAKVIFIFRLHLLRAGQQPSS